MEIWLFPSVLTGTLQGKPIALPSGGADQTKDEAAEAAGATAAEKRAQERPPRQGKLGEGLQPARKSW